MRRSEIVLIHVHLSVDESFLGDEALFEESEEVRVPRDIAGAADDIFERACAAVVVGDCAGHRVLAVVEELVVEDAAALAGQEALRVYENQDFGESAED